MKLNCPKCAHDIPASNINVTQLVAKCDQCDTVFNFAAQVAAPNTAAPNIPVPKPDKVTVNNQQDRLIISWSWFAWPVLVLTVFALFWNAIVLVFIAVSLVAVFNGELMGLFIFFVPHVWVAVWLDYIVLSRYLNKTTITVTPSQFKVSYGPIPSWGNKGVPLTNVTQFYTKESISIFKPRGNGLYGNIELHMISKEGQHTKLLSGIENADIGLFAEQTIEAFLNIEDQRVRGAL